MRWNKSIWSIRPAAALVLTLALAGCNQDAAKVYQVPKDSAPPTPAAADATPPAAPADMSTPPMAQGDAAPPAQPPDATPPPSPLKYVVPPGWQEKPADNMRVATFAAPGPNGEFADVSVIPLPVMGHDLELVNMWRSRVQLPATTDPEAAKQFEPVAVGAEQGHLYEFVSAAPVDGKGRQRLVVAMLPHDGMSWFFKITGGDACVTAQKKHFIEFLKSVTFDESVQAQTTDAPPPAAPSGNATPTWTIPPGWQSIAPAQFLLAEYAIPGANGAKAEVNVASMTGDGGGLLPNVNRWRGQLGLSAIGESDLPQLTESVDVPGGKATLVEFAGNDAKTGASARVVGAIVAQNGQTWFYKLMGDAQVVSQQKNAFTQFIQSANYANAR